MEQIHLSQDCAPLECEHGQGPERSPKTIHSRAAIDWRQAHEELSRLARLRAHLDWEEGATLVRALRSGAHLHLGFASFSEYIERLFGYKPRWTEERIRVAEALETLPALEHSLRDGAISWSAVRELTRVASRENEHEWLEVARGKTLRQIEALVAGHKPGDGPHDLSDESLVRHVLRFEVSADTLATFREAMSKIRRDAATPIDDDASLLLLARRILAGPSDAGRANYQLALTVCERCGRGSQQGRGEQLEVGPEIVDMAACDAQHLGRIQRTVPSEHPCEDLSTTHVGARSTTRARQDVPPAVRREVMRRHGGRCAVPGCRHAVFVDIHHIDLLSEGGTQDPDRLVVLCGAHHRAQHRGQLIVEGRASTGFVFRHADGTSYGSVIAPRAIGAYEEVFLALRALGFREKEVRWALERVRAQMGPSHVTIEDLLRLGLRMLGEAHGRQATSPGARPLT
jgi:hypothetical protein